MKKKHAVHDLNDLPGHLIRRLQQIAIGLFVDETADLNITPVQFALLFAVAQQPGLDQRTLAGRIGLDTSTIGAVIDRLEGRGIIERSASPDDKRVRLLALTGDGEALLAGAMPAMLRAQSRILAPLSAADRARFIDMLRTLVDANNAFSRAAKDT